MFLLLKACGKQNAFNLLPKNNVYKNPVKCFFKLILTIIIVKINNFSLSLYRGEQNKMNKRNKQTYYF